ncbi:Uma2 family endonuclease [Aeoliella sp. SH292]|jgi:Uma2 family endonuclease|uniref:Uma2 family endonuclease n=1 Tax=Aeoliella sp. SH292 TaxID=3454464 RepID=UPI003F99DD79
MATITDTQALIAELYNVDGKAEIVGGEIVRMSPTGDFPSSAAGEIYVSLRQYARKHGGRAYTDNAAFLVDLPDRTSFAPDVSYYTGPRTRMKFLPEAPVFAVEVRSENDYGPKAELAMAKKRADYFAAGTLVVWDVDLLSDDAVIRVYRHGETEPSATFCHGEVAEAEPAVPGWTMPVDEIFE